MRRILLAVDETEGSERAAEFVERFFAGLDVSITAVIVARAPIAWGPFGTAGWVPPAFGAVYAWPWAQARDVAAATEAATERADTAAERIAVSQAPSDSTIEVLHGDPVEAIETAAVDLDADIVVVGSNDKSWLERWFGRSVSDELVHDAPRPVLVVA